MFEFLTTAPANSFLPQLILLAAYGFLLGLAAICIQQLLNGNIDLAALFSDEQAGNNRAPKASRAALLGTTVLGVLVLTNAINPSDGIHSWAEQWMPMITSLGTGGASAGYLWFKRKPNSAP